MQVQAYCPVCKKTFSYDVEIELQLRNSNGEQSADLMGIPLPRQNFTASSGLYSYSVIHDDHILVLEIDRNGTVRKTETVSLIQTSSQKIIAGLTATLWDVSSKSKKLLIVSERDIWRRVLELVASQLFIDKVNHEPTELLGSFSKDGGVLKVGKVQLKVINDFKRISKEKGSYTDLVVDITSIIDKNPSKYVGDFKATGLIAMTFSEKNVQQNKEFLNKWFDAFLDKARGEDVLIYDSSDMRNTVKILNSLLQN